MRLGRVVVVYIISFIFAGILIFMGMTKSCCYSKCKSKYRVRSRKYYSKPYKKYKELRKVKRLKRK